MDETTATRLVVSGRVQGVGYRVWFAREASRRGLKGWVRNRQDGSVEALVAAPAAALEELVLAARRGPPAAAVTDIQFDEGTLRDGEVPDGFEVRPTAWRR
ncbi:acylphosphatase [Starkeya koreensis]|uniref:acylphosphatase n=1 Tax=Ancylobacter koreensis TaxID=266121 RepID=A0ABT0DS62_9HYPH|nr:acylphosphatase [Ancylobacter koreensis]MCK0210004.1 acylphosphatase [Ancylobacter koreensis]